MEKGKTIAQMINHLIDAGYDVSCGYKRDYVVRGTAKSNNGPRPPEIEGIGPTLHSAVALAYDRWWFNVD